MTAVVIANMIGTGVFTSLGFQLLEIRSGFVLMLLWALGGLIALCGAMTYAELGAAMPRSGGEYNFLSRLYHPAAGFVSGWVSATIGFAAPTALAAITFAAYAMSSLTDESSVAAEKAIAVALVVVLTLLHSGSRRRSGGLQAFFTVLKIVAILGFCVLALVFARDLQPVRLLPRASDIDLMTGSAFAISLIYVSYAYTGWNAATYLSSELEDPQKNLPRILFVGTATVALLYVALNYVFLRVAPMDAMSGQLEIGYIAAEFAFGEFGGRFAGMVLALLLVSTVSAMTIAGPRVMQVVGEDFSPLRRLAATNADGIPYAAIMTQSVLTLLFIITGSFESILVFAGFTLALNSFVTVAGIFRLRYSLGHMPRPYRTFGYPVTPMIYLLIMGWTLAFVLFSRPTEALFGVALIVSGVVIYWLASREKARD